MRSEAVSLTRLQRAADPEEIRLRLLESLACLHAGRFDEAAAAAEAAVAQQPKNADAHDQRGSAAIGVRSFDAAERDFRRALELAPDHTAAMSDLALLLEHRGDQPGARELLLRALELMPNNTLFEQRLASLERAMGLQPERAAARSPRQER